MEDFITDFFESQLSKNKSRVNSVQTFHKVFISVCFCEFEETDFNNMQEAIRFVKQNQLPLTRLVLKTINTAEEWDNF